MNALNRRTFLVASSVGFAGMQFGISAGASNEADIPPRAKPAKSTILFFLCGGASHIDTWDMKPDAPAEYRGVFHPIETSAPGVRLCEHLPMLAKQAHHLTVINSVSGSVNTNDHHAGYYYNLTGHVPDQSFRTLGNNRTPFPDDWPHLGTVVGAKRPQHPYLANAITLPHKPSRAPYTRPGQFAARLGVEHEPLYVYGSVEKPLEFRAPSLKLQTGVDPPRLASRNELLAALNTARREFDSVAEVARLSRQQQRAVSLLASSSTAKAFDVQNEDQKTRERYGETVNGMGLLMARRLVQAGVPFVTVFWLESPKIKTKCKSAGGWDTHGNNFNCLKDCLLPEFDRGFSALIEDLADRDMLDETLLYVTSEMGRKPKIGDPRSGGVKGAGRDHWTHALSHLLIGGGIRGGQTYGATDRLGEYPHDLRVTPAHTAKTIYYAMGIRDLEARDQQNRPYNLLADGWPLTELF